MRQAIYLGLIFVLAAATITLGVLYVSKVSDEGEARVLQSRDAIWLVSGESHVFDVTERAFDLYGLFGFKEGLSAWKPAGGPRSQFYPVIVAADVKIAIGDDEHVIGVVNGPAATAYPLRVLVQHQNVIDETQEPAVNVYFGENSRTAAAFSGGPKGNRTFLSCTGFLYKNVDLLFDYETESIFMPVTATFAAGKRLGERLQVLPSAVMTLGQWRKLYPATRIMIENTGIKAVTYPRRDVLGEPLRLKTRFKPGGHPFDNCEPIIAVFEDWEGLVVPFALARKAGKLEVTAEVHGRRRTVHFTQDFKAAWVTDESGALAASMRSTYRPYVSIYGEAEVAQVN